MNFFNMLGAQVSKGAPPGSAPQVEPGTRVYAVGDVHGRCDLLEHLHDQIAEDIHQTPGAIRHQLVFLGDYVDRGPESAQTVEFLLRNRIPNVETVHLLGNHEITMLHFLEQPERAAEWLQFGGDTTLTSYGVDFDPTAPRDSKHLRALAAELAAALPDEHRAFLTSLSLAHENGDYFFVHAGIDPARSLKRQNPRDFIWIREPFTECDIVHEKVVVHGHTMADEPVIRANRIGIDTGAYQTGKLTALALEGTERWFLTSEIPT
jgi:serine/threonine protein phosphatase 1